MRFDPKLEEGIRLMRERIGTRAAASLIGVDEAVFTRYLADTGVGIQRGNRWHLGPDRRPRRLPMYTRGRVIDIVVAGYEAARIVGRYMAATGQLQATNDPHVLDPYRAKGIRDNKGVLRPFETDANTLYRLMAAGPEPFEQIYRIVV